MMLPDELYLYFDGSCEPINPGGNCCFGWSLVECVNGSEAGREVAYGYGVSKLRTEAHATNNWSEWAAVRAGIKFLASQQWDGCLLILGDSKLVVNTLTGKWKSKKPHLTQMRDKCRSMLGNMTWSAEWIPRDQNERCDYLSRKADVRRGLHKIQEWNY